MNGRSFLCVPLLAFALPAQAPGPGTARLEGQVVDAMHEPVGNALVVAELDGEEIARTQSDGSGTFVFAKVPQQFVVVRATTTAPDIGAVQVDLLGEERGFARVVLMPARKVSGVVKNETGKPVVGAWVLASPSELAELALATCMGQSDANGRYELTHVAMGPVLLRAWAEGCAVFDGKADGAADMALDCVVKRDAVQHPVVLTGATAGQAAAAARLFVTATRGTMPAPLPPPLARPRPAGVGRWLLCGWPGDELQVHLTVPGIMVSPARHLIPCPAEATTREFTLGDSTSRLRGKLHGPGDLEAVGMTLVVQPLRWPVGNAMRFLTVAQEHGTFVVQAPAMIGDGFAVRMLSSTGVLVGNAPNPAWLIGDFATDVDLQPHDPRPLAQGDRSAGGRRRRDRLRRVPQQG